MLTYDAVVASFAKYGREPRPLQQMMIREIISAWDKTNVIAVRAEVGLGKSDVLRAIQSVTDAAIITSENTLVGQYEESFCDLNALKGKKRYSCYFGDTCADTFAQNDGKYCENCPYAVARYRATVGENTIFNPMSYLYNLRSGSLNAAPVLCLDEGHKMASFLRQMGSVKLFESSCEFTDDDVKDEESVLRYVKANIPKLKQLIHTKRRLGDMEGLGDDVDQLDKMEVVQEALEKYPHNTVFYVGKAIRRKREQRTLVLESLRPPRTLTSEFLKSDKIIIASGTLFPHHINDLVGHEPYEYIDLPSPIPAKQRRIVVKPCASKVNWETPPETFASAIKKIMAMNKGKRGIIHATYGLAEKLVPLLPDTVLFHDKFDKQEVLNRFKSGQAEWILASGMAEGIDLPGKMAEVNIITKLQWPYLKDPYVIKRKSLPDGELWFFLEVLTHLIQAAGRTTRSPTDFSITYLLDGGLKRVFEQIRHAIKRMKLSPAEQENMLRICIPKSLTDAIVEV